MTRFVSLFQQHKHLFGIGLAFSSGFLIFPFWLVLLEVVLGVGIWSFIRTHSRPSKVDFSSPWFFWGIFSVLVGSRFFIFFLSETPLGYDTGIYRYELWASFQALPEYVSQLFLGFPLLTNVLQLFGVPLDTVLGWFYGGLAHLLPLSMVLVAERMWGRKVGFFVIFLFLVSLIQWKAYTMLLFKQELSLALSFFAIFLLWKRSWLVLLVLP
ncbi:MAG: hypothetical protein U1C97_03670, partial [Candidatus Gracilibacteria bacterium]|nr:hypothetical protein [Candidatus Gracilibacteria bacterium]